MAGLACLPDCSMPSLHKDAHHLPMRPRGVAGAACGAVISDFSSLYARRASAAVACSCSRCLPLAVVLVVVHRILKGPSASISITPRQTFQPHGSPPWQDTRVLKKKAYIFYMTIVSTLSPTHTILNGVGTLGSPLLGTKRMKKHGVSDHIAAKRNRNKYTKNLHIYVDKEREEMELKFTYHGCLPTRRPLAAPSTSKTCSLCWAAMANAEAGARIHGVQRRRIQRVRRRRIHGVRHHLLRGERVRR